MKNVKKPWLVMLGPMLGAFVGMLSETSLNIALPQLSKSLGIGNATLQWLVTGYMLIIGIVLPLCSLLTKWFTTRKLITCGLSAFLFGAIISALAPSFPLLLLGRLIQGIGTGILVPMMFNVAMAVFPPQKLGSAMGICSLVIMFAPAIGPTLTGLILAKLSWHWIFWLFVPILLIALIFELKFLINIDQLSKPKIDVLSLIFSALGFGLIVIGFSLAADKGWASPFVLLCLLIGIVILTIYIIKQLHTANPILNFKIFKKEAFFKGTLLVMIDFAMILAAMFIVPQFIQKGMRIPVALAGIIMLPGGLINAFVSAIAGRLYDTYGVKKIAIIGFIIAILGSFMLTCVSSNCSILYVIISHCILMIGCPLAMSPSQTHALNALEVKENADGSTIINTFQQIVGAIATAVATSLLGLGTAAFHGHNTAAAFTNGAHYGFYFTIVLAIIGLLVSLSLKKETKSKDVQL